jgi:tRNA A-37 threonylcarbamoyl transferase component Bud32
MLQLHYKLCSGSAGAVVCGAYGADPAVVKLLGPDTHGLAEFRREVQAYTVLQKLQGNVVPHLLSVGRLVAGVHFIATRLIPGTPLSSLPTVPAPVADAAVHALSRAHEAHTGFIHGDIRLQNIMLVDSASGSDTTVRCMVIDFGRSRLDGTPSDKVKEVKKLKRMLGMA